jgi:CHAT domain-containing protein
MDNSIQTTAFLASICAQQGNYKLAEELYHEAIEQGEEKYGADAPAIASWCNELAHLYMKQGINDAKVEKLLQRALPIALHNNPDKHLAASIYNNLGHLYRGQGKLGEAVQMHSEALLINEKVFGVSSYEVALCYLNIAEDCVIDNRFDDSMRAYLMAWVRLSQLDLTQEDWVEAGNKMLSMVRTAHGIGQCQHLMALKQFKSPKDVIKHFEEAEQMYTIALGLAENLEEQQSIAQLRNALETLHSQRVALAEHGQLPTPQLPSFIDASAEADSSLASQNLIEDLKAQRTQNPQAAMKLIDLYEKILEIAKPDNPMEYVDIQEDLGITYIELTVGDRTANLVRAITCFQEALRFLTPDTDKYAAIQNDLGTAYADLSLRKDRATNLTKAIACYKEALHFYKPETSLTLYARIQNNLGIAYGDLLTGDRAFNLSQAITCFQEALRFFTLESSPVKYAEIQNNLGVIYESLPTGQRAYNLTQAISHYNEALRIWTEDAAPLDYARTHIGIGNVYAQLKTVDYVVNLEKSIHFYQEALRVLTPEVAPLEYALIQSNLGNVYRLLGITGRGINLTQAIVCFREALRVLTPEAAPLEYARTQFNLGLAYCDLSTGDLTANRAQAITYFEEALGVLTPEAVPLEYARTQISLGDAYSSLPTGKNTANQERAITFYREALRILTPESAPFDYALAQSFLGNAYGQLPIRDLGANQEQAILCYEEALRIYTKDTAPYDYAEVQYNLGVTYLQLRANDSPSNLTKAIACFQEALSVWTPESTPLDYAQAQSALGIAYYHLPTGNHDFNIAQAAACYQEALRFLSPETSPYQYRQTSGHLANLYFAKGEWSAALRAYQAAIDVGERLYRVGLLTESKLAEIADNSSLYRNAAFAAARCGKNILALLILEQGKTLLLAEALRLRVPRPKNVPDEVWNAFEQAGADLRIALSGNTLIVRREQDPVQIYKARMQAAQSANTRMETVIEQVRMYAPHFLKALDLPAIQGLLPDHHTAMINFCITEQGSVGFIVSPHYDQNVQVVEITTFTEDDLGHLLFGESDNGRSVGGWLSAYRHFLIEHTATAFKDWQEAITRSLMELGERLLSHVLSVLPAEIERIILIPSEELYILPLHAIPVSNDVSARMCDCFQVSYAPSMKVLADILGKVQQTTAPELYAVLNPTRDLVFASLEGDAIAQLFEKCLLDERRAATKRRVLVEMRKRAYLHFSCQGNYDWNDPINSGLALADGRLTLEDLQQEGVDLSTTRLATLSACETGITDVTHNRAEEYIGIPAGFMLAGVACVVSSLWEVPDLSTALLMERFYRNHLIHRMSFAAALREAQAWVCMLGIEEVAEYADKCYQQSTQREAKEVLFALKRYYRYQAKWNPSWRPFEHPYYWAAFTVNGL